MSREWAAVYAAMLTKPKYKRLSAMGRGALLHVFLLAGMQRPEATWDADELRETLILDGFPEGVFGELVALGWLEMDGDEALLHDWDEHQIAASVEIQRTWEAARKREWRRKKRIGARNETEQDKTEQDRTGHRSGTLTDMSGTSSVGHPFANVPPSNGGAPVSLLPCPRCHSRVRFIEGKGGPFYGCSKYPGCTWKSDDPPTPPPIDLDSPENRRLRGEAP